MSNPNNQEENTLKSWATGKTAMVIIGLALGIFIHETGIVQKVKEKIFSKKGNE